MSWLFRKRWHPEAGIVARLRGAWNRYVRHRLDEICGRCGSIVGEVWITTDEAWVEYAGWGDDGGILCRLCWYERRTPLKQVKP